MTKATAVFWLQATKSFQEGAPQRESYNSDEAFFSDCKQYDREWQAEFTCPGCENMECPQCGRKSNLRTHRKVRHRS